MTRRILPALPANKTGRRCKKNRRCCAPKNASGNGSWLTCGAADDIPKIKLFYFMVLKIR
jgi:hypothetical protein